MCRNGEATGCGARLCTLKVAPSDRLSSSQTSCPKGSMMSLNSATQWWQRTQVLEPWETFHLNHFISIHVCDVSVWVHIYIWAQVQMWVYYVCVCVQCICVHMHCVCVCPRLKLRIISVSCLPYSLIQVVSMKPRAHWTELVFGASLLWGSLLGLLRL